MDDRLFELHSQLCKIFASPARLKILNALRKQELSVGELEEILKLKQANISQHLAILRQRGIVKTRREGATIYYSLSDIRIIKAFDIIKEMLMDQLTKTIKLSRDLKKVK